MTYVWFTGRIYRLDCIWKDRYRHGDTPLIHNTDFRFASVVLLSIKGMHAHGHQLSWLFVMIAGIDCLCLYCLCRAAGAYDMAHGL